MINPFVKLELSSRQTKVRTSALQTFADVFCWLYHLATKLIFKYTLRTKVKILSCIEVFKSRKISKILPYFKFIVVK